MQKQRNNAPAACDLGRTCDLCAAERPGEHTPGCPTLFIEPACVHESDDDTNPVARRQDASARSGYRRSCNDIARAVTAALRKREALGRQVFTERMGAHDVRIAWRHYVIGYCDALDVEVDAVLQAVKFTDDEAEKRWEIQF